MATELTGTSPGGPAELSDWMTSLTGTPFDYSQFVNMVAPLASNPQTAPMANTILAQVQTDLQSWQSTVQEAAATSQASGGAFDQQVYNKLLQARQAILGRVQQMEQFLTPYIQQQQLQNAQIAEQAREFDVSTGQQGKQFDVTQALKQQSADRANALAQAQQQQSEAAMRADAWRQSMQGLSAPWSGNIFDPKMQQMYEEKFQSEDAANGIQNAYSRAQGGGQGQGQGEGGGQQVAMTGQGSPSGAFQQGNILYGSDWQNGTPGPRTQPFTQYINNTQPGLDPNWQQTIAPGYQGYQGGQQQPQPQPQSQSQGSFFDSSGFGGYGSSGYGSGGDVAGIGLVKAPSGGGDVSWFGQGTSGSPSSFTSSFSPFQFGNSAV